MDEFVTVLRSRIESAEHARTHAEQAGQDFEAHLHDARLQDLIEVAARHGVDASLWLRSSNGVSHAGDRSAGPIP